MVYMISNFSCLLCCSRMWSSTTQQVSHVWSAFTIMLDAFASSSSVLLPRMTFHFVLGILKVTSIRGERKGRIVTSYRPSLSTVALTRNPTFIAALSSSSSSCSASLFSFSFITTFSYSEYCSSKNKSKNVHLTSNDSQSKQEQLLVCTSRHGGHVGGQEEQKHLFPLGTKLYFHVNSSRKILFLTSNIAALSRGCKQERGIKGGAVVRAGVDVNMWFELVVSSLICSGFPLLLNNQHFQIPIRPGIRKT